LERDIERKVMNRGIEVGTLAYAINEVLENGAGMIHDSFEVGEYIEYSESMGTIVFSNGERAIPDIMLDDMYEHGWRELTESDEVAIEELYERLEKERAEEEENEAIMKDANIGGYSINKMAVTVFSNRSKIYYVSPKNGGVGEGTVVGARFTEMMDDDDILEYRIRYSATQCEEWLPAENVYASKLDLMDRLFPD
jgi:hypothetical protein